MSFRLFHPSYPSHSSHSSHPSRIRRLWLPGALLGLWLVAILLLPGASLAQQTVTTEQVTAVARELWCPLCNSVRLDTCELKACEQMREMIAEKLAAGASTAEIKAYFIQQYGPQVLGEPPRQGFNWLAWVVPFAALALAGAWVFYALRRWTRRPLTAVARVTPAPLDDLPVEQLQRLQEELRKID